MQVESLLLDAAQGAPDKVAIVAQGRRHTYGELDRRSDQLAHALLATGVERGDRIAIFSDNSAEVVIALFAILKAGCVFLIVNPMTKSDKLAFILNDCRAAGLIGNARLEPVIRRISNPVPSLRLLSLMDAAGPVAPFGHARTLDWAEATRPGESASRPPNNRCIDADLATIIYTSGSTGFPKGVMMTHLNVLAAVTSITQYLENTSDEIILSVLPLSFDYGLYQIFLSGNVGATLVIEPSFAYPARILERLSEERATAFPIIPTMAAILLQLGQGLTPGRFPHLRYITNTAAALAPAHIRALRDLFPTTRLYSMYGLTECKRVSYLPPELLERKPTSVGIAIPNTEVYIVDQEDRRVGPGVVGELVVRGSHVMRGYWEREEETSRVLRPGPLPGERVLYTGDLFSMDEEGCLYFVGRKDDIIKTRGEKVSPREVEAVLYGIPGVAEAAVIGVEDPILGQAIKAVIVPVEGATLTLQHVLAHCARHLEQFMVPKFVEFRGTLAKTSTGKISKQELRVRSDEAGR